MLIFTMFYQFGCCLHKAVQEYEENVIIDHLVKQYLISFLDETLLDNAVLTDLLYSLIK